MDEHEVSMRDDQTAARFYRLSFKTHAFPDATVTIKAYDAEDLEVLATLERLRTANTRLHEELADARQRIDILEGERRQ